MRHPIFLVSSSLIISLLVSCESLAADNSEHATAPSFASQSDATAISHVPAPQPGAATTLEIAQQPSTAPSTPARHEVPDERAFRKSEDVASRIRDSQRESSDHAHSPYIGISVEYSSQCFLGREEHGFEVMTVYPGSPAA